MLVILVVYRGGQYNVKLKVIYQLAVNGIPLSLYLNLEDLISLTTCNSYKMNK